MYARALAGTPQTPTREIALCYLPAVAPPAFRAIHLTEPRPMDLHIDGDRLWRSLMELARIGATAKGGVCRLALSDLDGQGRDLVTG